MMDVVVNSGRTISMSHGLVINDNVDIPRLRVGCVVVAVVAVDISRLNNARNIIGDCCCCGVSILEQECFVFGVQAASHTSGSHSSIDINVNINVILHIVSNLHVVLA